MSNKNDIPAAPKSKKIAAGLYAAKDAQGRNWTIERRDDLDGWFASCDDDRYLYCDPTVTKGDSLFMISNVEA